MIAMKILEKVLSDTDSIYCQKPTSSHQSSIFIAQTNSDVATSLFGRDYESNMPVVVEFSKTNLLFNILFHFLEHVEYYKRGSEEKWIFDKGWFRDLQQGLNNGFGPQEFAQFHVSVNKETSRTYIKGLTSVVCAGGISSLDLRRFLFSGDILKMMRRNDGVIVVAVADRGGEHPILTTKDNRTAFINWLSFIF
jgi:hypothetical protein